MPKLPVDLVRLVVQHNELRFSHWAHKERKARKRRVIRTLKQATLEEREKYARDVKGFLETNGHNYKQYQG